MRKAANPCDLTRFPYPRPTIMEGCAAAGTKADRSGRAVDVSADQVVALQDGVDHAPELGEPRVAQTLLAAELLPENRAVRCDLAAVDQRRARGGRVRHRADAAAEGDVIVEPVLAPTAQDRVDPRLVYAVVVVAARVVNSQRRAV